MTRLLVVALAASLFALSASARVGENEKEITARYGPPIMPMPDKYKHDELGNDMRVYTFHGFDVTITFEDGKSAVELFSHEGRAMSGEEVAAILSAYGDIWKPDERLKDLSWTSKDGTLKATRIGYQMQIGLTDYIERRVAKIKQNEADRLKGF